MAEGEDNLLQAQLPRHIAFIPDGNGRWAQKQGLPRTAGHIEGVKCAQRILLACRDLRIPFVSMYAFSTENWGRPTQEVQHVLSLLEQMFRLERDQFREKGIIFRVLGQHHRLPKALQTLLKQQEEQERKLNIDPFQYTQACFLISYGGRDDLVAAARTLALAAKKGSINIEDIDESVLQSHISTGKLGVPDPDLIIRTSGEKRLSNFYLWQAAYSEIHFVDKLWPDFNEEDLRNSLKQYRKQNRRFGLVNQN